MYDAVSNSSRGNISTMENPENAASIPGKARDGRSVQQQQAVIQRSDQMAAVSIADQQPGGSCTPEEASPLAKRRLTEKRQQEAGDITRHIADADAKMTDNIQSTSLSGACEPEPEKTEPEPARTELDPVKTELEPDDGDLETRPEESRREAVLKQYGLLDINTPLRFCLEDIISMQEFLTEELAVVFEKSNLPSMEDVDDEQVTAICDMLNHLLHLTAAGPSPDPGIGNEFLASKAFRNAICESLGRLERNEEIWQQRDARLLYRSTAKEISILERKNISDRECFRVNNEALLSLTLGQIRTTSFGVISRDMEERMKAGCA